MKVGRVVCVGGGGVGRGELASMHAQHIHVTNEPSAVSLVLFCGVELYSTALLILSLPLQFGTLTLVASVR